MKRIARECCCCTCRRSGWLQRAFGIACVSPSNLTTLSATAQSGWCELSSGSIPTRGILLKTYAEHRIRGAILDGLRGMDWLPRSARQKERQAHKESESAFQTDS